MKFKQFFFLLLLAGNAAMAQTIAVNTNDTGTGARVIITKNHVGTELKVDDSVAKSGLVFFSAGYQSTTVNNKPVATYFIDLDMFHNNNKLGCIKQAGNNVTLTLADGSTIQCFQISETECGQEAFKAAFAIAPKNGTAEQMKENFKKLQSVAIEKITVKSTEGELDYKIKSKSSKYIMAHFALVEKTLNGSVK
jgi:hypothetical protein